MESLKLPENQAEFWREVELPNAWPDQFSLKVFKIIQQLVTKKVNRLELPENLPGAENLPKYLLQEFHSLPNGNYSKHITAGYVRSFDRLMLHTLTRQRRLMAERYANAELAIDLGCGGGQMAAAFKKAGVKQVWGVEASPYLIQIAAQQHQDICFIQDVAENMPFPDACADVIGASFLFHEVPPKYSNQILQQAHRVLKPNGQLFMIEPSPDHFDAKPWQVFKNHGWRGLYFYHMAQRVHEPFVAVWHKRDLPQWFEQHGFKMIEDDIGMPLRTIVAERC